MPERAHKVFQILTLNQISPLGLRHFAANRYTVVTLLPEQQAARTQ